MFCINTKHGVYVVDIIFKFDNFPFITGLTDSRFEDTREIVFVPVSARARGGGA